MRTKKIFAVLTMLFMLFALTGCKENSSNEGNVSSLSSEKSKISKSGSSVKGALTSVNEWDYFPKLDIQADSIGHMIEISYKSETEQMSDVEAFKNKGSYTENFANGFYRYYPLGKNRAVESVSVFPMMLKEGYYVTTVSLDVLDKTTAVDSALFEELLGYKEGTLVSVFGVKYFKRNIAAKLQQYSALLEQQGFKKSNTKQWRKIDADNNRVYTWSYAATTAKGGFTMQEVQWRVALMDIDC
ncbi:MAG: hypothetical protein LBT96_00300 [Campylobacteraceae bacterium]|jgi:hypothetical protein|nr:hypothetical protein [Campylobacteraceae bacterium]